MPKVRGHYCWVCGQLRANERFSGRGRKQHVCLDCATLGPAELAFRQAVRDLERCVDERGFIKRKQRVAFARHLSHDDQRVRAAALELQRADAEARAAERAFAEAEWDEAPDASGAESGGALPFDAEPPSSAAGGTETVEDFFTFDEWVNDRPF